jgi:hypothetical protein
MSKSTMIAARLGFFTAALLAIAAIALGLHLMIGTGGASSSSSARTSTTALGNSRARANSTSSKAPQGRPQIAKAIAKFGGAYAAYLNGGAATALADASITANGEAHQDRRIPERFRDGILHVSSESPLISTCCSAQQTVVLANRQESYPFRVTVLDDSPHGWQVASLVPVDLAIDRHTQAVRGFALAGAAKRAAKRFAVAYASYKAGAGSEPVKLMTSAATAAITNGQDSLAGQELPHRAAVLTGISFGPPTGHEFAATATVTLGATGQSLSYLMTLSAGRWLAAAFL